MWIAFGLGVIVGLFSGMFLLGLIRELAFSGRKQPRHKRTQLEPRDPGAIPVVLTN